VACIISADFLRRLQQPVSLPRLRPNRKSVILVERWLPDDTRRDFELFDVGRICGEKISDSRCVFLGDSLFVLREPSTSVKLPSSSIGDNCPTYMP
jgi:hypothetical protein